MSLYKTLNYAYLDNADKVRIPVQILFCPSQAAKAHLQKFFGNIKLQNKTDRFSAQPDLSVPAKASQQTQHTAQQYGAASITSCACDLLRHAKMVDILLPSLPTWSQGHNGL